MAADALASFETKWSMRHPEFALALRFVPAAERPVESALHCLFEEIADSVYRVAERDVATRKLHWWAEELAGLSTAQAGHPLTAVLQQHAGLRTLPPARWAALLHAALSQSELGPAQSMEELVDAYRSFSAPRAAIMASLHPRLDRDAAAHVLALSRAFRDAEQLDHALAVGRLPLPLDLLARNRLSRVDLGQPGDARDAALRDHCGALLRAMRQVDRRGLDVATLLTLHSDRARCRRAARAVQPLAAMASVTGQLPLSSVWTAWRAARRMQRNA